MTQHLHPISTVSAGLWTANATTLHGDTDEGVDSPDDEATYAETDTDAQDMELLLEPGIDPLTGDGHVLQWRARQHGIGIGATELTVALYQGAGLIATGVASHTTTYSTASYLLTAAEANAITNYADLRVRVRVVLPSGTAHVHVTALELDIPSLDLHASQRGALVTPSSFGEVAQPLARGEVKDTR